MLGAALAALSGCGSLDRRADTVDVAALNQVIEQRTGIDLEAVDPPDKQPGLPDLRATYSGSSPAATVTVLDFYEAGGDDAALGDASSAPPGRTMLRRANVVIFYTPRAGATDGSSAVQDALDAAPLD